MQHRRFWIERDVIDDQCRLRSVVGTPLAHDCSGVHFNRFAIVFDTRDNARSAHQALAHQRGHDAGVGEGRSIAELFRPQLRRTRFCDLAQNAAHDFAGARFR